MSVIYNSTRPINQTNNVARKNTEGWSYVLLKATRYITAI